MNQFVRRSFREVRPPVHLIFRTRREQPSGPLGRWPRVHRVADEPHPHRPVPRSWLGKLVPGPEKPRQRDGCGDEPNDHSDRQHRVDPDDLTMRPTIATASPTYPTRRAQTAILQCPLSCSSVSVATPGIVPWRVRGVVGPLGAVRPPGTGRRTGYRGRVRAHRRHALRTWHDHRILTGRWGRTGGSGR